MTSTISTRVERLLNPTSVAVVGASERSAWSSAFIKNLERWDFPGQLHLVNPRSPEVFGRATTATIAEISGPVDHALICVPAAMTPDVLRDCAAAGVKSVTAIASGFAEAGEHGQALAAEVAALCAEHEISMVGPNCYGFVNFNGSTVLSRNWLEGVQPGSISLVAQSGQIGLSLCGSAHARGVDLRYLVSSGNELVVSSTDYFEHFIDDPQTRVLGGALERIADPKRFARIALRALEADKPIVVCKMGRSAVGQKVAEAHTASVAGDAVVAETFLRDHGVVVVDTVDDLIETAGVLARRGAPRGGRTLFMGGSGGAGGYFADLADGTPVELPMLSDSVRDDLAEAAGLEPASVRNPLDMTVAGVNALERLLTVVARTSDFDVVVIQGEQPRSVEVNGTPYVERVSRNLDLLAKMRAAGLWVCFASTAERDPSALGRTMAREREVLYVHGSSGVRALGHAIDHGSHRATRLERIRARLAGTSEDGSDVREAALQHLGSRPSESEVKTLLEAYGLPTLRDRTACTAEDAAAAAGEVGFPVVLKISSPDIVHKSDVGGVALDLANAEEVRAAFGTVTQAVAAAVPTAQIDGVMVSPFVSGGVEILLGVVVDPSLGPVVVVGAGGVYVELFGDTATALPPFDETRAEELLRTLRVWKLLEGARGAERADVAALCTAIARFSVLVAELAGSLVSLEINPLVARPGNRGAVALDAVIELIEVGASHV